MPVLPPETTVMDAYETFVNGFAVSRKKPWNRWQRYGSLFISVYADDEESPFKWIVTDEGEGVKEHADRGVEYDTLEEAYEDIFYRFVSEV